MDNIQPAVITDPKKGSVCVRSYAAQRGLRVKFYELRRHVETGAYFTVESFADAGGKKVPWVFSDKMTAADYFAAVAAVEFTVRSWEHSGWVIIRQWIKR